MIQRPEKPEYTPRRRPPIELFNVYRKRSITKAWQWCGHVGGESEDEIVRYYRTPAERACLEACYFCGHPMDAHGWIAEGEIERGYGHMVCPGDWIVVDGEKITPLKPEEFLESYIPAKD